MGEPWLSIVGGGVVATVLTLGFNAWWDSRKQQISEDWEFRRYHANMIHQSTAGLMEAFFAAKAEMLYLTSTLEGLWVTLNQLSGQADTTVRQQGWAPNLTMAEFDQRKTANHAALPHLQQSAGCFALEPIRAKSKRKPREGRDAPDDAKNACPGRAVRRDYGLNGILADEMGLGKTVQTLTALLDTHSYANTPASLIVCLAQRLERLGGRYSQVQFSCVDFLRLADIRAPTEKRVLDDVAHYDAVLTTYTTVTRDIELLSKVVWKYVVLDEAQKIKNHETATAKSCKELVAHHKIKL